MRSRRGKIQSLEGDHWAPSEPEPGQASSSKVTYSALLCLPQSWGLLVGNESTQDRGTERGGGPFLSKLVVNVVSLPCPSSHPLHL